VVPWVALVLAGCGSNGRGGGDAVPKDAIVDTGGDARDDGAIVDVISADAEITDGPSATDGSGDGGGDGSAMDAPNATDGGGDDAPATDGPDGGADGSPVGCGDAGPPAAVDGGPRLVEITTVTGNNDILGGAIAADYTGAAYLVGSFWDAVGFFPRPGDVLSTRPSLAPAGLVVRVDPSGARLWTRRIGTPDLDGMVNAVGAATTATGEVVIAGVFWGTVDLDPGAAVDRHSTTGPNGPNVFLLWLSPQGAWVHSRVIDPTIATAVHSLKIAANGNLYLVGGLGQRSSVTKLDPGGATVWTRTFQEATNPQNGRAGSVLAADTALAPSDGTLWVAGRYTWAADLDPGPAVDQRVQGFVAGYTDAVVVKLDDRDGTYRGGWTFGGAYDDHAELVAVYGDAVYVGGDFIDAIDFRLAGAARPMTAQPGGSAFLMRIDPGAVDIPSWVHTVQERRSSLGGLAVGERGVYLTGWWAADAGPGLTCGSGLGGLWARHVQIDGTPEWTISDGSPTAGGQSISVTRTQLLVSGSFLSYPNVTPEATPQDPFRVPLSYLATASVLDIFLATYDL
jgi:hypothetical protein